MDNMFFQVNLLFGTANVVIFFNVSIIWMNFLPWINEKSRQYSIVQCVKVAGFFNENS